MSLVISVSNRTATVLYITPHTQKKKTCPDIHQTVLTVYALFRLENMIVDNRGTFYFDIETPTVTVHFVCI